MTIKLHQTPPINRSDLEPNDAGAVRIAKIDGNYCLPDLELWTSDSWYAVYEQGKLRTWWADQLDTTEHRALTWMVEERRIQVSQL